MLDHPPKRTHPKEQNYADYPSNYQGRKPMPPMRKRCRRRQGHRLLLFIIAALLGLFCLTRLLHSCSQANMVHRINKENAAIVARDMSVQPHETPNLTPATAEPLMPAAVLWETSIAPTPTPSPIPYGYQPAILKEYKGLYEKNHALIGWLKVNCLYRINFAVAQGSNVFYMNHDFDGRENVNGAAFLDEACNIWPQDDNLIVYAHNMKNGDMFGELNKMQMMATVISDPFVTFDTLYEHGTYIPVAVYICSVVQADDYFQFYVRNFKSEATFEKYTARARELSRLPLSTDTRYGDELLTLVTCCDKDNAQRLVVLLRRLRDGETREAAKAAIFQ